MIQFTGVDVILEDDLSDPVVGRAVASFLGVDAVRVAVIDHGDEYPDHASADVVCVTAGVAGELSRLVSIQTAPIALPDQTSLDARQRLCELLRTRCLIPDEGPDPYCMWLLAPGMPPRQVGVDPDALEEGRYVLGPAR